MTATDTLKFFGKNALIFFGAIVVVSGLFILQALSISKESSLKLVKIHTASLPKKQKQVEQTYENVAFNSHSWGRSQRILTVSVPSVSASDFTLPATDFILQNHSGDFAIALFDSALGQSFDIEVFDLNMLDSIPKRLDKTKIHYPRQMFKHNVEGEVKLLVVIDESGALSVEKVLSSTNDFFKDCALAAAEKFVYETPTRAGKPVKARFVLPIPFRINK